VSARSTFGRWDSVIVKWGPGLIIPSPRVREGAEESHWEIELGRAEAIDVATGLVVMARVSPETFAVVLEGEHTKFQSGDGWRPGPAAAQEELVRAAARSPKVPLPRRTREQRDLLNLVGNLIREGSRA
jgi:hypothetical protein